MAIAYWLRIQSDVTDREAVVAIGAALAAGLTLQTLLSYDKRLR